MNILIKFWIEFVEVAGCAIFFTFGLRAIVLTVMLESRASPDFKKITGLIVKSVLFFLVAFMLLVQAIAVGESK